jgi:hypothetical protein
MDFIETSEPRRSHDKSTAARAVHFTGRTLKSGPFHWKIALDQISDVYATRNPPPGAPGCSLLDHFRGNHPALSLDRLRVNYRSKAGRRFYLISPRDKAAFLDDLAQAVPGLRVLED